MTAEELRAAARRLVERPDAGTAGVWPRAAALLARQALEQAMAGLWAGRPGADGLSGGTMRSQLLCLTAYVDQDVATRAAYLAGRAQPRLPLPPLRTGPHRQRANPLAQRNRRPGSALAVKRSGAACRQGLTHGGGIDRRQWPTNIEPGFCGLFVVKEQHEGIGPDCVAGRLSAPSAVPCCGQGDGRTEVQVEARLIPINAVLDLALADGLNPAPLAAAGWRVACLEVPVLTELGTVVCDVVLFNASIGHLLVVEAKSGANIEEGQARRLAAIDPQALIIAGGITIPQAVQLHSETLFACLTKHVARITKGISAAGLATPVIAVDANSAQLAVPALASADLAAALGGTTAWTYPIARIIPFDHESAVHLFDSPVRAELVAQMARHRPSVTMRALTEQVVSHFPLYGRRAQGQLVRKVTEAARRAARAEPERLQFEPGTGTTEPRVVVLRSPEDFDRRGRTQGYQAVFSGRSRKKPLPEVPGQMDLFTELDRAESVATDDTGQNDSSGSDDVRGGERR